MSNGIKTPQTDDLDSGFLLYRFSSDDRLTKKLEGQPQTDFLDVLATASNSNIPFLPIIWQVARASVGIGGTSSIRQAPIDIQSDLAFKLVKDDEKALSSRSDILALIRNEIKILSYPLLRAHPNIVDVLGLCWDIPDNDTVWPVLVFEKSYFGDLHRFAGLPIWKELGIKDRLKVCLDIGNALAEMHCCNIIHGDIKPQNVLVFKDLDTFVSKITDFGYSRHYTSPTEGYSLPRSKPWEAPEVDGSDKEFSLEQAKIMDIHSYALFCAWVLYGDQFLNYTSGYNGPINPASSNGAELESIMVLETLKNSKQLEKVVFNCVNHVTGLETTETESLKELFRMTLGQKYRASREIWEYFKLLEQPNPDLERSPCASLPDEFKINAAILQYYEGDHRVRNYIAKCLKQRVEGAIHRQDPNDIVQLAVCYHVGFGFPKSDVDFANLTTDENLKRLIEAEIHSIAVTPKDYDHPFIARIFTEGHLGNLHRNQQNQNFELLLETEQVLTRELDDLAYSINDFQLKWVVTGTLVDCLRIEGKWDSAEKLEREMLEVKKKVWGMEDVKTVTALTNLAHLHWQQGKSDHALEATQEALKTSMRTHGPDDPITLMIMGNIASICYSLGDYDQAEKLELHLEERRAVVLGKDHPDTLTSIANRAAILWRQGRLDEAEPLANLAYEGRRRIFGNDQPDTVISMSNLALICQSQGHYSKAEGLQMKAVEISKRILGELSPNTLMNMANLALNYWYFEKYEEAEDLNLHVVARRRLILGPDHPDTLTSIANLALVCKSQGRFQEAIDLETQVLEKSRATLGDTHPDTFLSIDNLSETFLEMSNLAEAEKLWSEALAKRKEVLGERHPDTMENTHKLLLVYKDLGKEQEMKEILDWLESMTS